MTANEGRVMEKLEYFVVRDRNEYATFVILQRTPNQPDRGGYYMLAIESSYGSGYAYAWSHPGRDFYEFLRDADVWYLTSKLSSGTEFDHDATSRSVREQILQMRRERDVSALRARELWDSSNFECMQDFHQWQSDAYPDFTDAWEHGRSMPDSRGREFAALHKALWPAFCEQLKARGQAGEAACA